ncbi:MAG: hypothetical protein ACI4M9_08105 [Succinivibrio sp.]
MVHLVFSSNGFDTCLNFINEGDSLYLFTQSYEPKKLPAIPNVKIIKASDSCLEDRLYIDLIKEDSSIRSYY